MRAFLHYLSRLLLNDMVLLNGINYAFFYDDRFSLIRQDIPFFS